MKTIVYLYNKQRNKMITYRDTVEFKAVKLRNYTVTKRKEAVRFVRIFKLKPYQWSITDIDGTLYLTLFL